MTVPTAGALAGSDPARTPSVIGWREWVALPKLGVATIKAKVDTGARSSSLHAWDIEEVPGCTPKKLRFVLHPFEDDETVTICAEARWVDTREVRSSNGEVERRPVVRTTLALAGKRFPIDITLTRRDEMGFRMLLGRSAIRRRFVVDPCGSFVAGGTSAKPPSQLGRDLGHRHPFPQPQALLDLPAEGGC